MRSEANRKSVMKTIYILRQPSSILDMIALGLLCLSERHGDWGDCHLLGAARCSAQVRDITMKWMVPGL